MAKRQHKSSDQKPTADAKAESLPALPSTSVFGVIAANVFSLASALVFTTSAGMASRPNNVSLLLVGGVETAILWAVVAFFTPAIAASTHPRFFTAAEADDRFRVLWSLQPIMATAGGVGLLALALLPQLAPSLSHSRIYSGRYYFAVISVTCVLSLVAKGIRRSPLTVGGMVFSAIVFMLVGFSV